MEGFRFITFIDPDSLSHHTNILMSTGTPEGITFFAFDLHVEPLLTSLRFTLQRHLVHVDEMFVLLQQRPHLP